jgi:hypothetical protein
MVHLCALCIDVSIPYLARQACLRACLSHRTMCFCVKIYDHVVDIILKAVESLALALSGHMRFASAKQQ